MGGVLSNGAIDTARVRLARPRQEERDYRPGLGAIVRRIGCFILVQEGSENRWDGIRHRQRDRIRELALVFGPDFCERVSRDGERNDGRQLVGAHVEQWRRYTVE